MPFKLSTLILLLFLTYSCKTQQNFTPDSFEGSMLTFGTEGGFAGTKSENYIFENGQLYRFESRKKHLMEYGKIDKDVVCQLFENYKTLGLDQLNINDPGNLTYFIKMKVGDEEKVIKWGGMRDETPPILKQYFKTLSQIVKKYKTVDQ